jgi:hypothetical protein
MNQIILPKHPFILRYSANLNDSLGLFYIGGNGGFQHYIIQDEPREVKVKGETRITAGIYPLGLRKEGGFHAKYSKKFPAIHQGMIQIMNVPNFKYILYHLMNTEKHTAGCVGGGDTANNNQITPGFTGNSRVAYERTYPKLLDYIKNTQNPVIEIMDIDI